ncbi:MAG: hypothetical protein BWK79_13135 [Beggiatoa sp. IS2]|nr:MAG: hypothetical protein BWK79_13135 [Beggiatoa sp. IS2]
MKQMVKIMIMATMTNGLITACSQPITQPDELTLAPAVATEARVQTVTVIPSTETRDIPTAIAEVEKTTGPSKVEQLLSKLRTHQAPGQLTLTLDHELFDSKSKSDLLPSAINDIKKIAEFLGDNPQWQVSVASYPGGGGSDYHWGLSERQASAIRFALMRQGVASNRIIARGLVGNGFSSYERSRPVEITMILNNPSQRYE